MIVEVTAEDIAKGQAGQPGLCPLALATSRRVGTAVLVGGLAIDPAAWTDEKEQRCWALSISAARFARAFDANRPVQPARFRLVAGCE